jgi:uncharacterized protein (TIGR00645 family)
MPEQRPDRSGPSYAVENAIERIVVASRWLQAPLYLGLVIMLGLTVVKFGMLMVGMMSQIVAADEGDFILMVLSLVDLVLVANLVIMVIISGYENFISRIDIEEATDRLSWFGKLDAGSLKIKLASSIVAISSIHLLKKFLEAGLTDNSKLYVLVVMHMAFVVSALLLAVIDRIAFAKKDGKPSI